MDALRTATHSLTLRALLPQVYPFLGRKLDNADVLTRAEKWVTADILHRFKRLAKLKVIPRVYGQEVSQLVSGSQSYAGDITIVPIAVCLARLTLLAFLFPGALFLGCCSCLVLHRSASRTSE
jgi:hypothetical protein